MPNYLSPGVFVEERVGVQPIQGVATNTMGMVGVTRRGPTRGRPDVVTSYGDFLAKFGDAYVVGDDGDVSPDQETAWTFDRAKAGKWWLFPYAVDGFFRNGGARLFVVRVTSDQATASGADAQAQSLGVVQQAADDDRGPAIATAAVGDVPPSPLEVRVEANSPGKWGDSLSVKLLPALSRRFEVFGPRLGGALTKRWESGDAAMPVVGDGQVPDGDVLAELDGEVFKASLAAGTLTIARGGSARIFARGTRVRVLTPIAAGPATTEFRLDGWTVERLKVAQPFPQGGSLARLAYHDADGKRTYAIGSVAMSVDPAKRGYAVFTPAAGQAAPAVFVGDEMQLIEPRLDVRSEVLAEPQFESFGPAPFEDLGKMVNESSAFVRIVADGDAVSLTYFPILGSYDENEVLSGGEDRVEDLTADDFVGTEREDGQRTGVRALEDIDDVAICAVPGLWNPAVHSALMAHCEDMRDRFAVLDPPSGLTVTQMMKFREALSSKYAAIYHPWLFVNEVGSSEPLAVPPSGHVAGVYARTDDTRGVHKAPANEPVRGIIGLVDDINRREQDLLNPIGVNAIRMLPNLGIRIWGARTLSSEPEWKYINVRRLFLFIEESIRKSTQWVVFEPNNQDLWSRVRQGVTGFLNTQWRSGALLGATQDEAFFVICDRRTMTQDDLDNGRLVVEVGISPVKPAEFVIFRFQQKTLDQRTF